jgi:hypothetical protein
MTARQASFGGAGARVMLRWCAVTCWLAAVVTAVMAVTTEFPWWACVLVVVLMVPLGFALWSDATAHRADTERLLRAGRAAVAEVIDMELLDPGDGNADIAVLRLRISGDGVPPFETTYRGDHDPEFRPGARLYATVDPADNLFTLRRL